MTFVQAAVRFFWISLIMSSQPDQCPYDHNFVIDNKINPLPLALTKRAAAHCWLAGNVTFRRSYRDDQGAWEHTHTILLYGYSSGSSTTAPCGGFRVLTAGPPTP